MNSSWLDQACLPLNNEASTQATNHQSQLTKPPGALGRLEEVAIKLAAMQGITKPAVNNIQITVFAADHGIAEQGVSAFPQAVTAEMIKNFARDGAAINVLAKANNAQLDVVNLGTAFPTGILDNVIDKSISAGTKDFSKQAAMSNSECLKAISIGAELINYAHNNDCELFIAGEMGIANTTSATAIACTLLGKKANILAGPGTGLDNEGIVRKAEIINKAIAFHSVDSNNALKILETFGGFEIAAIVGSYIRCAQVGIPILVDGFITSVAALVAARLKPSIEDWFIFAHSSAEPGHKIILEALNANPLLDLGMRLGEGSGAAAAIPLIKHACALHSEMATFSEAGVSGKSD